MKKGKSISLVRKCKRKIQKKDFKYESKMQNISNYDPRAHFIIIYNSSLVFTL